MTNNVVVILCGGSRYIGKNVSTTRHYYVTQFTKWQKYSQNTTIFISYEREGGSHSSLQLHVLASIDHRLVALLAVTK